MQKAEIVLTVLRKKSIQSKEFVFDRLYRNFSILIFLCLHIAGYMQKKEI